MNPSPAVSDREATLAPCDANHSIAESSPRSPCSRGSEHLQRRCRTAMQIRHLVRDEFDAAARLFADAFLDDPGWVAVGPDRAGHRHGVLRRYHRTALDVIERYGGPIYGAFDEGGRAHRRSPPPSPPASIPRRPGPFSGSSPAFSSPVPGRSSEGSASPPSRRRGIRTTSTCISGSSPSTRATSAAASDGLSSRACMEEPTAPVYLDTANPANVPYYASNGFEELGRADGPRGATMWFMRRP